MSFSRAGATVLRAAVPQPVRPDLKLRIIWADHPFLGCHELRGFATDAAEFPNDGEGGVAEGDERMYCGDVVGLGVPGWSTRRRGGGGRRLRLSPGGARIGGTGQGSDGSERAAEVTGPA